MDYITDLNCVELNYSPFMISLNKRSGSCNSANYLSTKICVLNKTKDINVKKFNLIIKTNEAKNISKTYLM